ncbi:MAG: alpha/beta hydrolase [Roseitalea porphyridii]|jgi:alpha-beta hydrolase superfamily lysophospholipase|uniref:alpha/beta hydrolase n=1 Tax=Roseitalea porphyridii TaxID=1852022 RepID=UPI0032F08DA9
MSSSFAQALPLPSPTGATLALRHQPAEGGAKAVVQINHGLAEHAVRYQRFALALAQAGFAVYAHDHRGHGGTGAPDAPQGSFSADRDGAGRVLADVAAVHDHIHRQHPDLPIFIFGHSMGGLIAMNFALRHAGDLAGAAVWNANFSGGLAGRAAQAILKWERFRLGGDVPSRALPALTFGQWAKAVPDRRTNFDWLSDIDAEVDAYIADPDCGWDASVGMWQAVFAMIFAGGRVDEAPNAARALPFFLAGGDSDPATDGGKAVREQAARLERAGYEDVTLHVFENTRHETLNSTVAEAATGRLIAWLEARLERA